MTGIIILIIIALVAYLNGDASLIVSILKFIGIGLVMIGFAWLLVTYPLFVILFFAIIIIFSKFRSSNNHKNLNNSEETHNNQNYINNDDSQIINSDNLKAFKAELQENTQTPFEVANIKWENEKENIKDIVNHDYLNIKEKLMNKAKLGQYSIVNNVKNISLEKESLFLLGCIKRHYTSNPTGSGRKYKPNDKVSYEITNKKAFDFYLDELKKCCKSDGIMIKVVFIKSNFTSDMRTYVNLPYIDIDILCITYRIKVYLICSVNY